MSGYNLRVEDYTKQNFSKILKKIIFYTVAILVIFLSVYFIIILDTDWHRIGSGEGILKQLKKSFPTKKASMLSEENIIEE